MALEIYMKIKSQEEVLSINKTHWERAAMGYGEDSNAAIIILSGNKRNIGTIIDVNHEIQEILGYRKSELIGENISLAMPEIIGANHNYYLERYFERQNHSNINEVTKNLVFGQHSGGYIIPCSKLVRIVPNLEHGVQFLGFLSIASGLDSLGVEEQVFANSGFIGLLLDRRWDILGFSESVTRMVAEDKESETGVNFKKYLESEQKINLCRLYPALCSAEVREQLKKEDGYNTSLDLSLLKKAISAEILDVYEKYNGNTGKE